MAIPTREPAFSDWVANFGTRIAALGAAIGIQPSQITAYDALYDTFVAARTAASVPGTKSRDLVTARNVAARNLLVNARALYRIVQNFPGVTDQQRDQLGIRIVKTTRTPVAPPTAKGVLTIVSVSGRTVRVHIGNDESTDGRRLPDRAIGFSLFSFVGENAPSGAEGWVYEGSTAEPLSDVTFNADLAPGAKVWFGGMFFNRRKETGPPSVPTFAFLSGGASEYVG